MQLFESGTGFDKVLRKHASSEATAGGTEETNSCVKSAPTSPELVSPSSPVDVTDDIYSDDGGAGVSEGDIELELDDEEYESAHEE